MGAEILQCVAQNEAGAQCPGVRPDRVYGIRGLLLPCAASRGRHEYFSIADVGRFVGRGSGAANEGTEPFLVMGESRNGSFFCLNISIPLKVNCSTCQ